jgi:hypothetical protein
MQRNENNIEMYHNFRLSSLRVTVMKLYFCDVSLYIKGFLILPNLIKIRPAVLEFQHANQRAEIQSL